MRVDILNATSWGDLGLDCRMDTTIFFIPGRLLCLVSRHEKRTETIVRWLPSWLARPILPLETIFNASILSRPTADDLLDLPLVVIGVGR